MKDKLFRLGFYVMLIWVLGDFLGSTHTENVLYTFWTLVGMSIFLGLHQDIKNYFSTWSHR